jgi:hypothetical protein
MAELTIALLLFAGLVALLNWRRGLLLALMTAILQDPLRKLTPDQPVYFVVLVGVVFGAACLGAVLARVPLTPSSIHAWRRTLALPFTLLFILICVQAVHSYLLFNNVMLPVIGLLTYLAPLPAIVFAYQLAVRGGPNRVLNFIRAYTICMLLALTTVYLEYVGFDWPIFGEVGPGIAIYDFGGILEAHSGIFRGSEIAAWHAATCACFFLLLSTERKLDARTLLFAGTTIVFIVGVGVLTGRRKMLVEIVIFVCAYFALLAHFKGQATKLALAAAFVGFFAYVGMVTLPGTDTAIYDEDARGYQLYLMRSKTVFGDIPGRVLELGLAPMMWAYDRFGIFGAGLGVGTQGTQYFGGGGTIAGAAEGGLGKIMLELGVPGLMLVAWMGIAFARHVLRIMRIATATSPSLARLSYGLTSFLLANVAAFSVATQAYGDLFILLVLGATVGFLLSIPVLARWNESIPATAARAGTGMALGGRVIPNYSRIR